MAVQQVESLGKDIEIEEARIDIERRLESSPPFRIAVHLATPGLDFYAEGTDHTLHAALKKTVAHIEETLAERKLKRMRQSRNGRSRGGPPAPRLSVLAKAR